MINVGDGATFVGWTDRHPFTVIEILSPKKIVVQADDHKYKEGCGPHEASQDCTFSPNPEGITQILTLRKNGRWVEQGQRQNSDYFVIGGRNYYWDPTF